MLSIIVSTYKEENFTRLKANIESTVGIAVEFISITNNGEMGLCEAYNKGASKAIFPYLCFVHDDVLFHKTNWGNVVIEALSQPETGVAGIMGGRYKSANGLGWRDGKTSFYRMQVISRSSGGKHLIHNPDNENKSKVLCLDGAFLCCRREVWQKFKFDENNFKGFHFYDIDFTFRVGRQLKNYVLFNIVLEHFSSGSFDEHYINDSLVFEKLYSENLPFTIEKLSKKEISQLEGYALTEKLKLMKQERFPLKLRMKLIGSYFQKHKNFYQLIRNLYFGL
jgi:hypothetical protein